MANRSLRGMRIGSNSMETEEGVEFAPRVLAHYDGPNGVSVTVPFSVEAEIPLVWEIPGGGEALLEERLELLRAGKLRRSA